MRTSARFALSLSSISDGHLEPDRVEQFQQAGEADGLAVVRRGRGEDAVLEEEADLPQHPGPLAGPAAALRGEVVALVHDQQVPRSVGRRAIAVRLGIRPGPGRLEELLQHVGHPQVVHRRDDAGEGFPGVRVDPQAAAKLEGRVRVDDLEVEVELAAQLVLPLPLEHRRAEDEDAADAPPQEQFFEDQPGLDRLAQADAIGQEQADTGHRQGLEHRLKLVGVDLDGRVPDAQERLVLDVLALPEPVQPGPAVGVDERLQRLGAVGPVGIHARQRGRAQDLGRRLDLPEQLLGFGVAPVVEVLDIDDVEPTEPLGLS